MVSTKIVLSNKMFIKEKIWIHNNAKLKLQKGRTKVGDTTETNKQTKKIRAKIRKCYLI